MSIDVIGAGLGRTGTVSFKAAVEALGFAPCWHIEDMTARLETWERLAAGQDVDWAQLFEGYRATSDFPACLYYRELEEAFPSAKVVLTVRDPQSWAHSVQALRAFNLALRSRPDMQTPVMQRWGRAVDALVWDRLGDVTNVDHLAALFEDHAAEVRRSVPEERLLVFDLRQGWDPLCAFLAVPVPDAPFPKLNERSGLDDLLETADARELRSKLRSTHG
jgi:hypothetical protein